MAENKFKVIDFNFTWNVEKVFSLFENCNAVESPKIPVSAYHSIYFTLAIEQPNKFVLTVHNSDDLKVKFSESNIVLSNNNFQGLSFVTSIQGDSNTWVFLSSNEFPSTFRNSNSDSLRRSNSDLCIKCHMFFGEQTQQYGNSDLDTLDLLKLSRDIRKLDGCQKFCDLKLQAESGRFNVHKAILFARAPHLLKESNIIIDSSYVNHVTNFTAPVFEVLLKYIYCSKLDYPNFQIHSGLLKAVNNLKLDNLKRKFCLYPTQIKLDTRQFCSQTTFTWSVENISTMKLKSPKQMKFSPVFRSNFDNYCQSEMSLEVVKRLEGEDNDIHFSVSLKYCFEQSSNIYFVKTKTSVLDIFGELANSKSYEFQVDKSTLQSEVSTWVYTISKHELDEENDVLLPNDIMTLVFDLIIYKVDFNVEETVYPNDSFSDLSFDVEDRLQLSLDLERLYESKEHSDVTIKVKDSQFKAHKIILYSRAPKLINTENAVVNRIEISDIDPNVFEILLRYLYSAKLPEITTGLAIKLYLAAFSYEITLLKQRCLEIVKNNLVF